MKLKLIKLDYISNNELVFIVGGQTKKTKSKKTKTRVSSDTTDTLKNDSFKQKK